MAVLEMQARSHPRDVRWTEVCAADHAPAALVVSPVTSEVVPVRPAPRVLDRGGRAGTRSVAPGRRVPARAVSGAGVRACRPGESAPAAASVVDDVPTWVLLAAGVVFAVLMLLALAFVGGPAYA